MSNALDRHLGLPLNRRSFVKVTGIGAIAAMTGLLAACADTDDDDGVDPDPDPATEPDDEEPDDDVTEDEDDEPAEDPDDEADADDDADDAPAAEGGTLRLGIIETLETPDPQRARTIQQGIYANMITDTLVHFDDQSEIQPKVAESWESSEDGLTHTFSIREGMLFHDGEPVDAEAVRFSFERVLDEDFDTSMRDPIPSITDVTVIDDYTVEFKIPQPSALMVPHITGNSLGIVSPTAVEEMGEDFPDNPVGSGPFKFVSFVPDQEVVLERFDDYWAGAPILDQVIIRTIAEDSTRLLEFENGSLEVAYGVPKAEVSRVAEFAEILQGARYGARWLAMSFQEEIFQDLEMRQAINYAIDRQLLVDEVHYGHADVATTGIPLDSWGNDPDIEVFEYDPEKAAELLDGLGWVMGDDGIRERDGERLEILFRSSSVSDVVLETQIIQEMLRQIGIDTTIESTESTAYFEDMRNENFGLGVWSLGGAGHGHPGVFADRYHSEYYWNPSRHGIAEIDEMIEEILVTADEAEATALASELQQMLFDNAVGVWLSHDGNPLAVQSYVSGLVYASDLLIDLENAYLDEN